MFKREDRQKKYCGHDDDDDSRELNFLETEEKMLIHCIMGNAVYCVVQIIFNGIIVFICNIFYEL